MKLTAEQEAMLAGERGETMAKVLETLVRYGDLYGADEMVSVTSKYNHLVTSFGLKALGPVYELMGKLIDEGAVSQMGFSVDPRPLDDNVPASFLQKIIFKHFMYSKQDFYEGQLRELGLMGDDAFTCTCYMDEVGNVPAMGDVLSWSESSAVVYENSVLGALQPQLGHHRFDGVGVRVRATVWAADRRRQTRRLGGRGALRAKARGAAFGFGHRHARDGRRALHHRAGRVAGR